VQGSGLSSPVESAPPSGVTTPTKASTKVGKRIDVITEYQKRIAEKESLNLVVIGKARKKRGGGRQQMQCAHAVLMPKWLNRVG
jgi:hypothetical protein